ncbi:MAG: glycosyltransferase family 2 protein [Leadbetterella sp.]
MNLSVIIVGYNCWDDLRECLLSLLEDSFSDKEIIVCENSSVESKFRMFTQEFPSVQFHHLPYNPGFAKACNYGAMHAKGDTLLFLNPDTTVEKNTLETIMVFKNQFSGKHIFSCKTHKRESKIHLNFPTIFGMKYFSFRSKFDLKKHETHAYIEPDWISGSFMMLHKTFFEEINRWSEEYWMYYEDVDLCQKAKLAGGNCILLLNTQIYHKHGGASRKDLETTARSKAHVLYSQAIYSGKFIQKIQTIDRELLQFQIKKLKLLSSLSIILPWVKKLKILKLTVKHLETLIKQNEEMAHLV